MKTLFSKRTRILIPAALIAAATLIFSAACSPIRQERLKTTSARRVVKMENVKSLRAEIEGSIGEIRVAGGTDDLMDAKFAGRFKPLVDFTSRNEIGFLTVKEPPGMKTFLNVDKNSKYDVRLNEEIPLDLKIESGVGRSILRLGDLDINQVRVEGGVGDTTIDLRGRWDHDVDVNIDAGVGTVVVRIPRDFGVRVDHSSGVGRFAVENLKRRGNSYVNAAYAGAKYRLNIDIDQGIGGLTVK